VIGNRPRAAHGSAPAGGVHPGERVVPQDAEAQQAGGFAHLTLERRLRPGPCRELGQ